MKSIWVDFVVNKICYIGFRFNFSLVLDGNKYRVFFRRVSRAAYSPLFLHKSFKESNPSVPKMWRRNTKFKSFLFLATSEHFIYASKNERSVHVAIFDLALTLRLWSLIFRFTALRSVDMRWHQSADKKQKNPGGKIKVIQLFLLSHPDNDIHLVHKPCNLSQQTHTH